MLEAQGNILPLADLLFKEGGQLIQEAVQSREVVWQAVCGEVLGHETVDADGLGQQLQPAGIPLWLPGGVEEAQAA